MNDNWWVNPKDLDEHQLTVIDVPHDQHQMIYGPPGSGKTNLLLLKAGQLVLDKKPNFIFLAFTRSLREFIAACPEKYNFPASQAFTITGWMEYWLRQEEIVFRKSGDFEDDRRRLANTCLLRAKQRGYKGYYNAIFIDEAQDCTVEEVQLFDQLAEVLIVAADEKQRIYSTPTPLAVWHEVIPEAQHYQLPYHYRNGRDICLLADGIIPVQHEYKIVNTCKYDEKRYPSKATPVRKPFDEQVEYMVEALKTDMKAYPGETLGVLCPRRFTLEAVVEQLRETEIHKNCQYHINDGDGYTPFDRSKNIVVSTVHSAKGLEYRTGFIVGAEFVETLPQSRNLAFTAVTRVKTSLRVLHEKPLPPFFAGAFSKIQPKPKQSGISAILGFNDDVE